MSAWPSGERNGPTETAGRRWISLIYACQEAHTLLLARHRSAESGLCLFAGVLEGDLQCSKKQIEGALTGVSADPLRLPLDHACSHGSLVVLLGQATAEVGWGTCWAMAHTKPISSRATAATDLGGLCVRWTSAS